MSQQESTPKKVVFIIWGTESNVHSQAVDDIVTKLLVFKIKVHPTYKRCSVIQVSEDSQVIGSLLDKIAPVMDTMTIERGKVVGGMLKEDDGFEYMLGSIAVFEDGQDFAFAQMSTTKNMKHIDNE
ncbi:hypothetical protein Lal_00031329 [Lupinus albus]|nr:hypothetical protein Lal_00031329 [Lupinus albus]